LRGDRMHIEQRAIGVEYQRLILNIAHAVSFAIRPKSFTLAQLGYDWMFEAAPAGRLTKKWPPKRTKRDRARPSCC
jgi:hypothetical protein